MTKTETPAAPTLRRTARDWAKDKKVPEWQLRAALTWARLTKHEDWTALAVTETDFDAALEAVV